MRHHMVADVAGGIGGEPFQQLRRAPVTGRGGYPMLRYGAARRHLRPAPAAKMFGGCRTVTADNRRDLGVGQMRHLPR